MTRLRIDCREKKCNKTNYLFRIDAERNNRPVFRNVERCSPCSTVRYDAFRKFQKFHTELLNYCLHFLFCGIKGNQVALDFGCKTYQFIWHTHFNLI